jgi:hypothetical protein
MLILFWTVGLALFLLWLFSVVFVSCDCAAELRVSLLSRDCFARLGGAAKSMEQGITRENRNYEPKNSEWHSWPLFVSVMT